MNTTKNNENIQYIPHPYELFGVECGKGWYKLLQPIFDYVENYNKDKDENHQIKFTQIKEKWGTLRVYVNFGTDELFKLIDEAEDKSENTCEICGTQKNVGMKINGWYTTMCLDCIIKEAKQKQTQQRWTRNEDNKLFIINPNETIETI